MSFRQPPNISVVTGAVKAYKERVWAASHLTTDLRQVIHDVAVSSKIMLLAKQSSLRTWAGQLSAGADVRPFAGPPLPRLGWRDALRRAAACERPHAAQRKNVSRTARKAMPPMPLYTQVLLDCLYSVV